MKLFGKQPMIWGLIGAIAISVVLAGAGAFTARAADPIKIGFGMALTGGLSANGKPALLAMQIWKDAINKKGGLLGRPVELVFYDDQTNPATVPGIYSKLLDVDKVHLVVSGYGTNLIAPLMPIAMERKLTVLGIFGLANNEKYHYPNYFQISPTGPDPATSTATGFFELAAKQTPKPQTVALVGADAEYPQTALVGARELIKRYGFKTVYDRRTRRAPRTSRRSCARSRRPTPRSCSSRPTRLTRWGCCARRTRYRSSRSSSAAAWWVCSSPPSWPAWGRC